MVETRYFALKPEQTPGTFEAPSFYVDSAQANFVEENRSAGLSDISAETARRFGVGRFAATGPVETVLDSITAGYFLYGLMGSVKSTKVGTTYAYSHEFPDTDTTPTPTLPSFSCVVGQGPDVEQEKRYTMMGMNRGSIVADANSAEGVRLTVEFTGNMEDIDPTLADPTFDDIPIFEFVHGSVTLDAGSLPCHSITIEINNNIDEDNMVLGSRGLYAIYRQRREITITYDIPFESDDQYNRVFGSSVATSPQDSLATVELDITLDTAEIVEGTYTMELLINIPRVVLDSIRTDVADRNRIIASVEGYALFDTTDKTAIKFTLVNDKTSYAS
jgi:hypothetical protein